MTKLLTVGLALVMAVACHSNTASKATSAAAADTSVVQVYYFHGKQRCKTCNAVEQVAQQAIQANYAGNTKVVFTPVPMDEPANKALVEQYQVSFSSLIVAKGTRQVNLTELGFANAVDHPEVLAQALKQQVDQLLP